MFDFTPLTTELLILVVIAFVASYFGLSVTHSRGWLRSVPGHKRIFYAGALLLAATILFATFILRSETSLLASLVAAGLVVLLGGLWDEQRRLIPGRQLMLQCCAASVVVLGGWTIRFISQPTGSGVIVFDPWLGGVLAVGWLLLLMNAMNWLDGVDGLASSVAMIALLTLGAISLLPSVQDPKSLALSLVGAASVGGFLIWNWPPARIYLGTIGSWFLGLYIGMVAIGGGGKIATTLLVLALPVVDILVVSALRLLAGQKPWHGDNFRHLHHRLQNYGFSHRSITLTAAALTLILAIGAILLQTYQKVFALVIAAAILLIAGAVMAILNAQARRVNSAVFFTCLFGLAAVAWLVVSSSQKPCRNFHEGTVSIGSSSWSIAVADTAVEHNRGLMECLSMPQRSGMYFIFKQPSALPFWMKNMALPLDIIWIRENKIIGIEANVPPAGSDSDPPRYYAPQPYTAVLELPAGEAQQHRLVVGQEVLIDK